MRRWPPQRVTPEMAVRILADVVLVNAGLVLAVLARYLWSVVVGTDASAPDAALQSWIGVYARTAWLLTLISILVFYSSGFYTRGRTYQGRYKAVIVMEAVSLSYLIFSFFLFLLREVIAWPRSVLIVGWGLTLALVLGARLWMMLWRALVEVEHRFLASTPPEEPIKRVLVVGGAGYIGSALVGRLLEVGHHVRVLDLLLYGDDSIAEYYDHPNFELDKGDFRHIDAVVRAARGMDAIVHLGAIVGDSACTLSEDLSIDINLRATATIAQVGKGFGVRRFVFASTCSVYGASDEILDERSALCPISLYARTKVQSEKVLLSLSDANFAPVILRFGTIYGLSGRPRFDLVVNLLTAKAVQEGEAGIFGGAQWRPLVHVKDVAEAILLTLQAPLDTVRGQIFNVGSNEQNYRLADLGSLIQKMVPAAHVVTVAQDDNRSYRVQFDKIHRLLNFQPKYTVQDGIKEIVDAFASGKLVDYRQPRYSNFAFLHDHSDLPEDLLKDQGRRDWDRLQTGDGDSRVRAPQAPDVLPNQEGLAGQGLHASGNPPVEDPARIAPPGDQADGLCARCSRALNASSTPG
jgi:nucleoside-diphosphate-sugar epimerase